MDSPAGDRDLAFEAGGYYVGYRLPTSADLIDLAPGSEGRIRLLRRCLTSAARDGVECPPDELPAAVLNGLVAAMAAADPRGDLNAALVCPSCDHRWQAAFDIVSYFWEEIGAWVRRMLHDVHVLALAYGWREDDVLELSPWRRRQYLALVRP